MSDDLNFMGDLDFEEFNQYDIVEDYLLIGSIEQEYTIY